ncbi:hypothetical protein [Deinococcus sonorensis]|uniref:TubC N-terminal docking domain-containing protein n=2 Tax=Deinococcus sonorensis TaxID=309891 RepID=A0AAU7UBU6_9DEIO
MVALDLLAELGARGVTLAVQDGKLTARGPKGAVTQELAAAIQAEKAALMQRLQGQPQAAALAPLPEPLVRLIRAAAVNSLGGPAKLPTGHVSNLGDYVLAAAALYAAGLEPERQLSDLWAARGAWVS